MDEIKLKENKMISLEIEVLSFLSFFYPYNDLSSLKKNQIDLFKPNYFHSVQFF